MTAPGWKSAISPFKPPVPRHWHWASGLLVSLGALGLSTYIIAAQNLPDPVDHSEDLDSMIVSLGAPAQRLEPPPPPPPDVPPPEPPPEPQVPTERAEDAPPPEAPPEPRPVIPAAPPDGRLSSGFGEAQEPAPPPPPPPPQLRWDFVDYSTRQYISRVRYPESALRRQLTGTGILEIVVDKQGKILSANIVQSTGERILDREIDRVSNQVDRLDPLPDYYTLPTARLRIPFVFLIDRPD